MDRGGSSRYEEAYKYFDGRRDWMEGTDCIWGIVRGSDS